MNRLIQTKKILVTGAYGLLGSEFKELSSTTASYGKEIVALGRGELDVADPDQIERAFEAIHPAWVINCAAYTNVDRAESETEEARRANVEGPRRLAQACLNYGAKLIHYSTNFVFDGKKKEPYVESDLPEPLNVYASSKLEGEIALTSILPPELRLILRISWPYGKKGKYFIHSLWELGKTRPELRVVDDQIGTPNPAGLLAEKTLELMNETSGLFHLSCGGSCSRYELIRFLFAKLKSPCRVIPVSSDEFPSAAKRPAYSVLGSERGDLVSKLNLPSWEKALTVYLERSEWK